MTLLTNLLDQISRGASWSKVNFLLLYYIYINVLKLLKMDTCQSIGMMCLLYLTWYFLYKRLFIYVSILLIHLIILISGRVYFIRFRLGKPRNGWGSWATGLSMNIVQLIEIAFSTAPAMNSSFLNVITYHK